MTFIHGYLLFGLSLAALPVLIHLIMPQKPKQLRFPAFRFLRQKAFINRRKLQIQHLILLLLRMLLIAALCLGLARPKIATHHVSIGSERAIAAVLLIDTSMSMEYTVAGVSRFDEARQRASELLDEMSEDSDLVILDSGDDTGGGSQGAEWIRPALARNRIEKLRLRPANSPLNRQIDRAFRLLRIAGDEEDPKPRFLYIFSDRTRESWDASDAKRLEKPEGVTAIFVDVGVDNPRDLAIDKVEVEPPVVGPGMKVEIKVIVRSTGGIHDTKLTCQLDNDPDPARQPDKRTIALAAGQSQLITIERVAPALPAGMTELPFQARIQLATNDALPFNNNRFVTFLVREPPKVLTIADEPVKGEPPPEINWQVAIKSVRSFSNDVMSPSAAEKLNDKALSNYKVVCLFQLTRPSTALWDKLQVFVRAGGGLVLVPGGDEVKPGIADYNTEAARRDLLPARWGSIAIMPANQLGVRWGGFPAQHPLTAPIHELILKGEWDISAPGTLPLANAFWDVTPVDGKSVVITPYAEQGRRPILVERAFGRGKVIQLTTPLDGKPLTIKPFREWHNYFVGSFGMILVDVVCKYLAGDTTAPELNYNCGVPPMLAPPPPPPAPPYTLQGPNLTAAETNLAFPDRSDSSVRLHVPQATNPGQFTVLDGRQRVVAGFSVNVRPEESQLERVPVEEIELVLGAESVLPLGRKASLKDAMQEVWAPPLEMMPWLMMLLLVVLVAESLLANKFYRMNQDKN